MIKNHYAFRGVALGCTAAIALGVWAAPDDLVVHLTNSSSPLRIELTEGTKITFEDAKMNVTQSSGPTMINIADIDRMVFDLQTSSSDDIDAALSDDLSLNVDEHLVTATSASGKRLYMRIYEVSGRLVRCTSGQGTATFDFSGRAPGVYIIIIGDKTIKYLNK